MLFSEIEFVFFDIDVGSLVGNKTTFVERIFVRMGQRNELILSFKLRERER
jgi:hypothetical protein